MTAREIRWLAQIPTTGRPLLRIGRIGDRRVAEWPEIGTLYASSSGEGFEFVPAPGASASAVNKLSSGLTRALLRHLSGRLTLHASAAQIGDFAIACLGESGLGKSTQIAALLRSHRAALVADDTLAIEFENRGVMVSATESVSWLLADARAALGLDHHDRRKIPIEPQQRTSNDVTLGLLVILSFDDALPAPRLRRLRGHELLVRLIPSVVRFALDDPSCHRRELDQLTTLAGQVPIYELARPRDLTLLDDVSDLLLETANAMKDAREEPSAG